MNYLGNYQKLMLKHDKTNKNTHLIIDIKNKMSTIFSFYHLFKAVCQFLDRLKFLIEPISIEELQEM